MIRKWNTVNDPSNTNHDVGNKIICNKEVLKSNLCDYNEVYVLVWDSSKWDRTIIGHLVTQVAFKNCVPFSKCITNIDEKNSRWCWRLRFGNSDE